MYAAQVIDAIDGIRKDAPQINFADKEKVLRNLLFMHQVITASEGLLAEAIMMSSGDLQKYYVEHLKEERGHQEWLAQDLAAHGIDVKTAPIMRKAAEMAGSQYYLIKHVNPVCLLGYMAVLEGFPIALDTLQILEDLHGKDLFKTVRYHSIHDAEHRKEVFDMIDRNPDPLVMQSALQTMTYMAEFSEELTESQ